MRDALLVAAAAAPASPGVADRALLVVALLATATLVWWLRSRRTGTFRTAPTAPTASTGGAAPSPGRSLTAHDVQHVLGERATFVQFSSSTCATCPQVRRMLTGLADGEPGVVHVEVDAERSMDLVRRFGVYRTPAVLLVGPDGSVRSRTSGPITPAQARAALDTLAAVTATHTETATDPARSLHV